MKNLPQAKQKTITLACRNYDGTSAILRGLIEPEGFRLRASEENDVPKLFTRMFNGEFDVAEMSLAELVYYNSRGVGDFVGIPVFPFRMFRHGFVICNNAAGIRAPEELDGKRVGFIRWVQTAAIWMRGMLAEEYGCSPKNTQWYVASMQHWNDAHMKDRIEPKDGSFIRWVKKRSNSPAKNAWAALKEEEIDAVGLTEAQIPFIRGDSGVKGCLIITGRSKPLTLSGREFSRSCTSSSLERRPSKSIPTSRRASSSFFRARKNWAGSGSTRSRAWGSPGSITTSNRSWRFFPTTHGPSGSR